MHIFESISLLEVNDEKLKMINVYKNKNTKVGKQAAIVYNMREFEILNQKDWLPIIVALRHNEWFTSIQFGLIYHLNFSSPLFY